MKVVRLIGGVVAVALIILVGLILATRAGAFNTRYKDMVAEFA